MDREPLDESGSSLIRPYVMTGGRTRPEGPDLPIESVVVASPAAAKATLGYDEAKFIEACQEPIAIAELASALDVPLGVARILVADLVGDGMLDVNPAANDTTASPDLIERLIEGIRAL